MFKTLGSQLEEANDQLVSAFKPWTGSHHMVVWLGLTDLCAWEKENIRGVCLS